MSLEQQTRQTSWNGSVPNAFDARVLGFVVVTAALAASMNVPYGGLAFALVAFAMLAAGGIAGHVIGERQLRNVTETLVDQWIEKGAPVEGVTRSSSRLRTEWTVHTAEGDVTVGGLALAPISRVSIEWGGTGDALAVTEAEAGLEQLADDWHHEIFRSS